jgi:hypothetical protein
VLRRRFGPKSEEVTEVWRKLHNEELHITLVLIVFGLDPSSYIIQIDHYFSGDGSVPVFR